MRYVPDHDGHGASLADQLLYAQTGVQRRTTKLPSLNKHRPCWVRRAVLSGLSFISLVAQLVDALSFLESNVAGFIHGDLKPENILIDFDWPLLCDRFWTGTHAERQKCFSRTGRRFFYCA
jgi:hypothetical protein